MVAKIDYYNKQFNSNLYIGMTQEEIYEEIIRILGENE